MTNDSLRDALSQVKYPGFSRDIISFGLVKSTEVADGIATVKLQVQTRDPKSRKLFSRTAIKPSTPSLEDRKR